MKEIIAQRVFDPLYIVLDSVFLVVFLALLIVKKRYCTAIFGALGGILYMIVDYGIFHLMLGTRSIENGNMFWVLLWMSLSYGITNFSLLWIWMSKDKHSFEWSTLIFLWWFCCPILVASFGGKAPQITIARTTGAYHGVMAIILLVGYIFAIVFNLFSKDKSKRLNLLWLLVMGVAVQFSWEFSLLLGGIRSAGIDGIAAKLSTLVVNSLLETNLGVVPIYFIFLFVRSRLNENLTLRAPRLKLLNALQENNSLKYKQ